MGCRSILTQDQTGVRTWFCTSTVTSNREPIEAQSADLFQPCKWIFPLSHTSKVCEIGVNGSVIVFLCLFIPTLLCDVNSEMTVKAERTGEKRGVQEEITTVMIPMHFLSQQGLKLFQ